MSVILASKAERSHRERLRLQAHRIEFAADALGMGRAPVNPAASQTAGEALLARVDEGRHAAHDRVAGGLGERFVAARASGESSVAGIERKERKDFAQLIAGKGAFEIKRGAGRGPAPVAGAACVALGARPGWQPSAPPTRRYG